MTTLSSASHNKMADVESAKGRLAEVLAERAPKYWDLMKNWYKRKISKDDFDTKAKFLLGEEGIVLHNQFLFAILLKCQRGSEASLPGPSDRDTPLREEKRLKVDAAAVTVVPRRTLPYGALDDYSYLEVTPAMMHGVRELDKILLCSQELMLPDVATMHTRILLQVWENGLEGVEEESARLLLMAVEYMLKGVISCCVSVQCSTTVSHHNDNAVITNRSLAREPTACIDTSTRHTTNCITPFELRDALVVHGTSCLPCHSIRMCNMERITARLWHPSSLEMDQRDKLRVWQKKLIHSTQQYKVGNSTVSDPS